MTFVARLAVAGFLVVALAGVHRVESATSILVGHRGLLWRIHEDGRLDVVTEMDTGCRLPSRLESECIFPSPDATLVAFACEGDLCLYDVASGEVRKLTDVAEPETDAYFGVEVLFMDWSWHSDQILAETGTIPTGSEPGGLHDVDYGAHIYNLTDGTEQPVSELSNYHCDPTTGYLGWLPNGDFLCADLGRRLLLRRSLATPGWKWLKIADEMRVLGAHFSNDGQSVAVFRSDRMSVTRISSVNLQTGISRDVTEPGKWADYDFPQISPNGKLVAYKKRMSDGGPRFALMVETEEVHSEEGFWHFRWVSDDTLVILHPDRMIIVDRRTGHELARRLFDH